MFLVFFGPFGQGVSSCPLLCTKKKNHFRASPPKSSIFFSAPIFSGYRPEMKFCCYRKVIQPIFSSEINFESHTIIINEKKSLSPEEKKHFRASPADLRKPAVSITVKSKCFVRCNILNFRMLLRPIWSTLCKTFGLYCDSYRRFSKVSWTWPEMGFF